MSLETFFTVSEQTRLFLMSVLLGAGLGILFDCFRVIRIIFPQANKKGAVCAADIVFMLCCGIALFLYSFFFGRGIVRMFFVVGACLGFVLYLLTIGSFITFIIRSIANAVYRVLRKVYSVVFAPFVKVIETICQKIRNVFVHSHKNV